MKQLEKAIEELDHWLEAATTHPQLLKDIINGLTHWHNQIPGCQPYTKGVNSKATSGQYRLGTSTGRLCSEKMTRRTRAVLESF